MLSLKFVTVQERMLKQVQRAIKLILTLTIQKVGSKIVKVVGCTVMYLTKFQCFQNIIPLTLVTVHKKSQIVDY